MATAEEIITAPITGSRKKYKKKLWIIGLSILAVAVLGIGAYVLLPPLTPAEAAEQYIENHYDSIAEKMAYTIMPDSTIKAEIAAEIVESFAENIDTLQLLGDEQCCTRNRQRSGQMRDYSKDNEARGDRDQGTDDHESEPGPRSVQTKSHSFVGGPRRRKNHPERTFADRGSTDTEHTGPEKPTR